MTLLRRRPAQALFVLLCAFLGCDGATPPSAPDVLLVVIDTLRADHVGCYGYDRATTPGLDRLAAGGVRFADCTAQSSWTGPSMASLLLARHVADDFVRMPAGTTLAEAFAGAGYRTGAVQSNVLLEPGSGFERGFEEYLLEPDPDELRELISRDDGRPRFLYVHLVHPHDPYTPAAPFDVFKPRPLSDVQRAAFADWARQAHPDWNTEQRARAVAAAADRVAAEIARYDGEILMADRVVDAVVKLLPRPERTVIAVTSDHGECLWERREAASSARAQEPDLLRVFKQTHNTLLTQELVHVPFLLHGPGVPAGVVVAAPVENVDVAPTLLALAGIEPPAGIDGRSLAGALAAGQAPPGRDLVFANTSTFTAARGRGFKLILPWLDTGPDRPLLFHLPQDPGERTPLPLAGDTYEALRAAIVTFRSRALRAADEEDVVDDAVRRRMQELGYLR